MASDDFSIAANPLGAPWATGTNWNALRAVGGLAATASGADSDAMMAFTASSAIRSITEFDSGTTDGGPGFMNPANGNAYIITSFAGTVSNMFRVDGGPPNYVQLGGDAANVVNAGDFEELYFDGNDVVYKKNNVEIMRRTDATYRAGLIPGVFAFAGNYRVRSWSDGVATVLVAAFDRIGHRGNRPGRGPYSRGIYLRPSVDVFPDPPAPPPPFVPAVPFAFDRVGQRDNRPGRGPYSLGRFFRPRVDAFKLQTMTLQLGMLTETDSALTIGRSKNRLVGLTTETDATLGIARNKLRTLGLTTETDAALGMTHTRARTIGLTTETDATLGIARNKLRTLGLTTEADTVFSIARGKLRTLGMNTETDQALGISSQDQIVVTVGLATETDQALGITRAKLRTLGLASELDTAQGIARLKRKVIGLASEADTAFAIVARRVRTVAMGLALELDVALPVARSKGKSLGLAIETDQALPFDPPASLEPSGPDIFERPDGEPATLNPIINAIGTGGLHFRAAGSVGVVLARFGWANMAAGTITTALQPGTAVPVFVPQIFGAVGGRHALFIQAGLKWLRPGYQLTVFVQGDFWTRFPAGARRGDQVHAGILDGAPFSGYAPNALPTPFYVVQNADPGELSIISTWERF